MFSCLLPVSLPLTQLISSCRQTRVKPSCVLTGLWCFHILCCNVRLSVLFFCWQSEWEVFGLLGELWSSILSGCLMVRAASIDNAKGCEGGGWRFPCQTGGTGMKLGDYSLRCFMEEGKLKREEEILANNSCSSPGSSLWACVSLSAACSFSTIFFHCFFHLGSEACSRRSEHCLLKACGWV